MAEWISDLSAYKSAMAVALKAIPVAPPHPLVRIDSDIRLLKISCNYNVQ
jgi:hypothetical protein